MKSKLDNNCLEKEKLDLLSFSFSIKNINKDIKMVDYTLKCKELVIALYISKYFLYGGTQWNFFNGLLKR
ncbi:hypothetical protein EGX33_05370 [Enterococcus faecalis]|nr:hypothetical protein [Enterococcus faecalis]ROZ28432.1 hypothetical protein EGX33_05370 [Enterococcus faecalis]